MTKQTTIVVIGSLRVKQYFELSMSEIMSQLFFSLLISAYKHILWVLIRSTMVSASNGVPTIYIFMQQYQYLLFFCFLLFFFFVRICHRSR